MLKFISHYLNLRTKLGLTKSTPRFWLLNKQHTPLFSYAQFKIVDCFWKLNVQEFHILAKYNYILLRY